jgi:WbqC-like protein
VRGQPLRVVVLQPSYLPWLGYFDQLHRSDVFVLYDDVQYDKHGWRNRNRIKTPAGAQWLTVPVLTHGQGRPANRAVRLDAREPWGRKHLAALRVNYAKAPAFDEVLGALAPVLEASWTHLLDVDRAVLEVLCGVLGLRREIRLSSELGVPGTRTERLVAICETLGATVYLSGDAAATYLDEGLFRARGIEVEYHRYRHPVYRQLHGPFVPYLSVVDLLMNHGSRSLAVLTGTEAVATEEARA